MMPLADVVSFDAWNLGSISGIIVITGGVVEVLKKVISKNQNFGKIPVFVYSIFITLVLATIANKVIKQPNGTDYMLPGPYLLVLWRSFLAAASTSGFYSWINNPESVAKAQPLGSNKP